MIELRANVNIRARNYITHRPYKISTIFVHVTYLAPFYIF